MIIQLREAALLAIKKAKKEQEAEKKKEAAAAAVKESTEGGDDSSKTETAMEVEGEKSKPEVPDCLESLSDQLSLASLWNTLSNCLKELAETPDHHAVLVLQVRIMHLCLLHLLILCLQPTVEAFFLVHAAVTSSEEKKKPNQKETRKEQLSHIEEKEGQLESEQPPQVRMAFMMSCLHNLDFLCVISPIFDLGFFVVLP